MTISALPNSQLRQLLCSPVVRVQFDWDRWEDTGTFRFSVPTLRDVAAWYAPWYVDAAGDEVPWDHPGAAAVTLGDVAADITLHPSAADRVAALQEVPMDQAALVVVTYQVGAATTLLLDGNHRMVAALRSSQQPRILQAALSGPVDPAICPDLAGWSQVR